MRFVAKAPLICFELHVPNRTQGRFGLTAPGPERRAGGGYLGWGIFRPGSRRPGIRRRRNAPRAEGIPPPARGRGGRRAGSRRRPGTDPKGRKL